jgi:hypothetical protein
MTTVSFPFRFHPLFRLAALPFGVRDDASVQIGDDELRVRYGPWRLRTPLSNVRAVEVTGPYAWPKVIGPPHLSFADRGLTFASNPDRGVCIRFSRPVPGIEPVGVLRHPSITVTVDDPAVLAELLDRPSHHPGRSHASLDRPSADELLEEAHDELRSLSAADLRRRAQERGIAGASRRSKAELITLLDPSEAVTDGDDDPAA